MARLTSIIALLALALVIADAHRTTITTVEVDEENPGRMERCRQMRAREEIGSCGQYLSQQSRYVLQMRGIDNQRRRGGQLFDECCSELTNVEEECRCELLQEIAMEEQRRARGQERTQMLQTAKNLPSMCGMRPQQCYF
ncbi:2S albumin [Cucumis sativus]|uniref:Bifunctional inhibitor/plant lipid transfer protein/seed storage helical domain-containing protein n=1 Tax=Cucumis sativus TaxID=3659 RepID=A0A0A0L7Q2_CUCSA|nr:2S albumin [Cucumis sativus]